MQIGGLGLLLFFACFTPALTTDLMHQNLATVPSDLSTDLTELILANNIIKIVNADSFRNYIHLAYLELSNNGLEVIEDGTFDKQIGLTSIGLEDNNIRQLPSDFGPSTTELLHWDMDKGYVTTAIFKAPYFASFTSLNRLVLGGLEEEMFQDASLLPRTLETFDLFFTILTTVPDLSNAPNLKEMQLAFCSIEHIPQQHIDMLIHLESLSLNNNELSSMPNVSHMPLLFKLYLDDNLLQEIPRSHISGLVSLELFYVNKNSLHAMPNISYLSKLTDVEFSENDITEIPASTLYGIPKLLTLKLTKNKISVLGDISTLWAHVYLKNNLLTTLPDLYDMRLETLMLEGNPLTCNQSLCWLRMWPWNKTLPTLDNTYCSNPSDMSQLKVVRVHPIKLKCFNGMAISKMY